MPDQPLFSIERLEKLQREQKEKFKEFDSALDSARIISRDTVYKIILLCTTIVGFSVTLMSINTPIFSVKVDVQSLQVSWYLFLITIILGFLSLLFEGRLHYALTWRTIQVQDHDKGYKLSLSEKIKVYSVVLYSIVSPRNLFFCRIYKTESEKRWNARMNAVTIITLAEFEKATFVFENLFLAFFIFALFTFIRSYSL